MVPIDEVMCLNYLFFRFKNKPNMSFDDVGMEAEQEFELFPDPQGMLEYSTKYVVNIKYVFILLGHRIYYIRERGTYIVWR